jgi:hypothetical protein
LTSGVRWPYAAVGPYSKCSVVALVPGLTVPFSVAAVVVAPVTGASVTAGSGQPGVRKRTAIPAGASWLATYRKRQSALMAIWLAPLMPRPGVHVVLPLQTFAPQRRCREKNLHAAAEADAEREIPSCRCWRGTCARRWLDSVAARGTR